MSTTASDSASGGRRRIATGLGVFDVGRSDLVQFPGGLPGFDRCSQFAVVTSPALRPFHCLCAVDGPPATFLTIDPRLIMPEYRCALPDSDRDRLGATESTPLVWLAVVTVSETGEAWANLRAPIVIAADRMIGCQVLPADGAYPVRHPLIGGEGARRQPQA